MNGKANVVRMGWMAVALLPLLIGFASAANLNQSQTDQQMNQSSIPNQQSTLTDQAGQYHPTLEKARDLIGAKVVNDRGEQLGTIRDIVLTPDHSAVSYIVLSPGSTWGMGGKLFAVPWSQFHMQPGERVLVLNNVSKADLDRAKGFDPKHWPATANENWLGVAQSGTMTPGAPGYMPPSGYVPPAGNQTATQPRSDQYQSSNMPAQTGNIAAENVKSLRVSEMMGKTIHSPQGEKLGKLNDVVIDAQQGKVAYGILSLRGAGVRGDFAAVPWSAFQFTDRPGVIRLDTTRETLAAIAFPRDNFPNLADPQYSRQLFNRFHVTPYWEALGFVPSRPMEQGSVPSSVPNPNAVQTIHGTIQSIGTYPLPGTSAQGVLLNVKTADGRIIAVQAGPQSYAQKQNFVFHVGDEVTILGAPTMVAGHNVIAASQITMGSRTLNLLNKEGQPLWKTEELQSANNVPSSGELSESGAPAYNY
jgi:sporulation protein YlmC with PRC-barrel domain